MVSLSLSCVEAEAGFRAGGDAEDGGSQLDVRYSMFQVS